MKRRGKEFYKNIFFIHTQVVKQQEGSHMKSEIKYKKTEQL